MKKIRIKPIQIIGKCPIGITRKDEFIINGMLIEKDIESKLCFLAISQIPIGQGIWQLQSEERFFSHVSCPGCIQNTDNENRIVFLLGHEDKWELCKSISHYLKLTKQYIETADLKEIKNNAIRKQYNGDYKGAAEAMKQLIEEYKKKINEKEKHRLDDK